MIKLTRGQKPNFLSDDKVRELTEIFKSDATKLVWKNNSIGTALLKSSSYKCAYCECKIQVEDSYMQVEHFKDKDTYPDDVVSWDNLLPSCGRCNRKKWTLDVCKYPIINPYIDDPKDHLTLEAFRLYSKDEKGELTIKKLFLNDDDRLILPRFLVCNEINKQLSDLIKINDPDDVSSGMSKVLSLCQADKPYSAFLSSTLHSNSDYKNLKNMLEMHHLWDTDLELLHNKTLSLIIESRKDFVMKSTERKEAVTTI